MFVLSAALKVFHISSLTLFCLFKVDLLKTKDRLLDITADLTCGIVNGRKLRVKPVIKPQWTDKRPQKESELSVEEGDAELDSVLSKEQLKKLKSQRGWAYFKDVFMLSSVDREDVGTLKVCLRLDFHNIQVFSFGSIL